MSEPNSPSEPTPAEPTPAVPPVPPAPSFTYGTPDAPAQPVAPPQPAPGVPPAPAAAPVAAPPQYGERLPGYENGPAYAAPTYAAPAAAPGYATPGSAVPGYAAAYGTPPPPPRRRTWDVVLTVALLVVGLIGMIIGLFYAWILSDPTLFREAMASQGMNLNVDTRGAAVIIGVSHPVLYLVAAGLSILLLIKNKVAFWVPLAAGVIAAIVFWGTIMAVVLSDPTALNSYY